MTYDDDREKGYEARHTSQTRFGPRPVPQPRLETRRVTPSGKVSPDGLRNWPSPSLTSKILVWGGVGIAAAAATAGAIMATRKIADAISGSDEDHVSGRMRPLSRLAPRFADLDEDEREAVRKRVRAQASGDSQRAAQLRAGAARRRPGKANFASDLTDTAAGLSSSLNGVVASISGAVAGFRSVAEQAGGIVREFSAAADTIRDILDRPDRRDTADTGTRQRAAQAPVDPEEKLHRM